MYRSSIETEAIGLRTQIEDLSVETFRLAELWEWRKTMSIKSKLALVAVLSTIVAAPAFAIDQQASTEAGLESQTQLSAPAGAYASVQTAPRAERFVRPIAQPTVQTQDFQAVGSH